MTRSFRWIAGLIAGLAALALLPGQARAASSFQLGFQDEFVGAPAGSPSIQTTDAAMGVVHGSVMRVPVYWTNVAPEGPTTPSGFDPSNPADPHYNWTAVDGAVRWAQQLHARVILDFVQAPLWAEGPNRPASTKAPASFPFTWDPNPADFAQFVKAAAIRYGGSFPDPLYSGKTLPRVSYWEMWNEENLPVYLEGSDLVDEYRALLDAGYSAVKAVHPDNVVVLGGLAPVSYIPPISMTPLQFAAQLMCLHRVRTSYRANASCPQRAEFDVFAIHPYSPADSPTKHAYVYDNVLVGDMGKVATLVKAADRLHTVSPSIHHQLWVTEFAWYTNPPDAQFGDPPAAAARYVAYSMYEIWHSGVDLVIWDTVRDFAGEAGVGDGLYDISGAPKTDLWAYAFPFIASVHHRSGFVWGRVPVSKRIKVRVERRYGRRWRVVATARTARDGIFVAHFRARGNGLYRAVPASHLQPSLTYNSRPIPPARLHDVYSG